jgi:hypothetical protein
MTPTSTPRLSGLSPKQNRTVPPIRPELARRLKAELPGLHIELNGTRQRGAALPFLTPVILCHSRHCLSTRCVNQRGVRAATRRKRCSHSDVPLYTSLLIIHTK